MATLYITLNADILFRRIDDDDTQKKIRVERTRKKIHFFAQNASFEIITFRTGFQACLSTNKYGEKFVSHLSEDLQP